ncbi:hypothetical protein B7P43_G17645 [Cryptotermes secundus]|uniref:Envelope fusion protein n=1 Tax=Cryptotermes secundus TaxID=105785 RepID=A0A2J7Q3S8_9NEOP|nr:hypothetical protein B7P43_G17645 [Cryptotermes secundus]
MRELDFMAVQLQQSVMLLQEGLETNATGRLSSDLIPPHNLSMILQQVILKLPQDISLIAGFTVDNMYIYYEVAKVQAYATTTAIRLVVRIPLRGADRVMTLFRSVPLPAYSEVLKRHVQIEPETLYLAVTENGQYYSLLTTADLQRCKLGIFAICEATFPFIHKTRASCSSALYFGQAESAHDLCRKHILNENFNPVWLQAKGPHLFWIYKVLPSPTVVAKKCKVNGTTQSSNLELSHTGTLTEDTHCQFYSEAFVLLPVSDGYTNVTITGSQIFLPHLPELISPGERDQIMHDETQTHRALAALETIARQSSPDQQQSYVELRELLATMASKTTTTSQTTWVYALVTISIILSLIILISRLWQRPIITLIQKIFPRRTEPKSSTDIEMKPMSTPTTTAIEPDSNDCPCCTEDPSELMEVTSHPATPLRMEVETVSKPAPVVSQRQGNVYISLNQASSSSGNDGGSAHRRKQQR